ncbi:Patatin-like phospholipase [Catalinimonas alkaloidigena]|uniref:Patatin-like phospholipase n=1 Tax=Catalinimonas alkaloidigena TaxID=1075417 RepID=A0A1G9GD78_9BACT|nr:patatin-like phospholipase family protein [Catalinimonas alkaloidigena]SDK98525.1 Patatin-like phospholipase [Catalinimonas alkaloidigena]
MNATQSHRVWGSPPAGDQGPRRALVLAGGGMRVAYQAGVLQALDEAGLCFHHADGTSGGTLNLAMLFSGLTPTAMADRWQTLPVRKFVSLLPLPEYLRGPNVPALGDADGIERHVLPHLGIDVAKIRAATGMVGTFNVCNYGRKTNEAIPHADVELPLLVAGVSLPMLMPAVTWRGASYVDAVWIKDANLMEAVKRGAEEIWLVWCIGNHPQYLDGPFNQYVHMIEMSANGVLFEEFDRIRDLNERIARGEPAYGQTRPIRLHVIRPAVPLPLDPDFYVNRIDAATLISLGYADAKTYLETRSEAGIAWTPEATAMQALRPGIAFRETMEGWFHLGSTEPHEGAARGKAAGTKLALHAAIYLHDLDAFVEDADHAGHLTGRVAVPGWGEALPGWRGKFNLFTPTNDPTHKRMVYELAFVHDGQPYYLAGHKDVRDDPGFDLLSDTTTLYITLHRGTDATGPVVGAGILKLSLGELTRLLRSLHAINGEHLGQSAALLARFGQFFAGALWEQYVA